MNELEAKLHEARSEGLAAIAACGDLAQLAQVKARYLGRQGSVSLVLEQLGQLPKEQKPVIGRLANEVKRALEEAVAAKRAELETAATQAVAVDPTLPGRRHRLGRLHPLTQIFDETVRIFRRMGFAVEDGPEIETEWHCFDALNTPANHPARDIQDTLYVDLPPHPQHGRYLLRTHTSPVQIRTMLKQRPPVRIVAPGRVFRRDNPDATHSPMFHQIEGLYVDRNVTVADLKGTVEFFFKQLLDPATKVRFRPHFFPYTEPSFEIDLSTPRLRAAGKEWIEIAGCGMVDPNVFSAVGYPPDEYTGWAFGFGIERLAMVQYGIPDIRLFTENDVRFLEQF
ncbi:MAG: phenylalanine--tRNA ligase subunit alpha [Verrucomicrobiae bacterium]|nr:phenylalanine--tRNA ligase subunit alpha [Verrucomicrobiae bacterium]